MKHSWFLIRLFVSVAISAILLWLMDWNDFAETMKAADGYWLLAVFVLIHMDRSFMAYKWKVLCNGSGVPISTGTALQAYYVGTFWGSFLPLSCGGDVVRMGWTMRSVPESGRIISSIIIERLFGALAIAIVSTGSVILFAGSIDLSVVAPITCLILVGSIVTLAVVFSTSANGLVRKLLACLPFKKLINVIESAREATFAYRAKPSLLLGFWALCLLEQAFPIIVNFMLAKAFSIDLSIMWAIVGMPIIMALATIPISVSAFGVQEGAYAFVFSLAGVPLAGSVMISVANRALSLLAALPGALFWELPAARASSPVATMVPGPYPVEGE